MQVHSMAALERGAQLTPWQYNTPPLGPYDCIIRVRSCGLCHSDIHIIDGDFPAQYPVVPGHEAVGEIIEKGSMVNHLEIGQRVGVGWQRSSCLQCPDCLKGNENLCSQGTTTVMHGYGGFGNHIFMDSRFCFAIPDGIDTEAAGPLLCAGVTVYSALRSAGMTSGQNIGIIGVGGLGHLAVQFASRLGNRVTVFTTSPDKAEFAAKMGAHESVLTEKGEKPHTSQPQDIIISTVPADLVWSDYVNLLGTDGTLTFVGIAPKPISIPMLSLLDKRRRIMGSPIGGRAVMTKMLEVADTFGIAPVIETFPMKQANEAIQKVRDNTVRYRAVLTMD